MEAIKKAAMQTAQNNDAKVQKSTDIAKFQGKENVLSLSPLLELIKAEGDKVSETANEVPGQCGMFKIKTANETMKEAASRPDPKSLWAKLWYEGEVCCLFADSGLGKSIYAVQISNEIARSEKVLYFDFELSDKQFQLRYTDERTGSLLAFPDNLYRVEIDPESIGEDDFEGALIDNIEDTANRVGAKVLVIDNLTWLCNQSEKGDMAGRLMMRLMTLKKKYGWSLLVLAHTPKRPLTNPITQNDLAGSKKLYNFFDSVFAIGQSAADPALRYIKQLKVRYGKHTYDANNVIVCYIDKVDSFTKFISMGYATEREHLKAMSNKDDAQVKADVMSLRDQGKSFREIADELSLSKSKVERLIKSIEQTK